MPWEELGELVAERVMWAFGKIEMKAGEERGRSLLVEI
jgi:hypothetical protein